MRDKVKNISDEDFESEKSAVNTIISEKDPNLSRASNRNFVEIKSHLHVFDRQAKEIALLATITKAEFQATFEQMFFSEQSARLDLMLTSQSHKESQAEVGVILASDDVFAKLPRTEKKYESTLEIKQTLELF